MIELDLNSLALIKKILKKHFPIENINGLKFEFSNSDLLTLVDIIDWNSILKNFMKKLQEVV